MLNNNKDSKQTEWEYWFITSVILFLSIFFIAMVDNKIEDSPYFQYYITIAGVNLLWCISVGLKKG